MGIFDFITKSNKKDNKKQNSAQAAGAQAAGARAQTKENDYSGSGSINRYRPKSFDDVAAIIDRLLSGEPVIVDVSAVSPQTAQRVVDLMSGAIYAIDGNMGELTKDVYVFTPRGMKA